VDNQHRAIVGYRELNAEEIAQMNTVKTLAEQVGELVEAMQEDRTSDPRWVSIAKTHLQQGFMALSRAIAKPTTFVFALLILSGCSTGLQETAFKDESGTYVVVRSLVNDRVTANQPHASGVFACDTKISSEQMAELRADGAIHSEYTQCQPIERYRPGAYQLTADQPIGTIYKGPVEAAILGVPVGTGLALSGTEVVQQGNVAAAGASSSATGGSAINKGRHRR